MTMWEIVKFLGGPVAGAFVAWILTLAGYTKKLRELALDTAANKAAMDLLQQDLVSRSAAWGANTRTLHEEFSAFQREEEKRWREVERTLGRIEGAIDGIKG